ncbi:MAG TPA: hypothetical protein VLG44_01755 [Chlamydiales bacterium]|nr:hypothetical protein [Chlamydiales bacterium]
MRCFVFGILFLFCSSYAEEIRHECGVALVRLLKPIDQYEDPTWGLKKALLLMEKQRNRGQDGAGLAVLKLHVKPGEEYQYLARSIHESPLDDLMAQVAKEIDSKPSPVLGEIYLGHLRYATHSQIHLKNCQPFIRSHSIPSHHFAIAGNFNMTNTSDLFQMLKDWGLFPTSTSDTQVILDMIAYYLDKDANLSGAIKNAASHWDGGYVLAGMLGNGDVFICRDPSGIRPGYYYKNEMVFAAASERSALMEAFDLNSDDIHPLPPGQVVILKSDGNFSKVPFISPTALRQCSFERIYFSKATDLAIYEERKALGRNLASKVWKEIGGDLSHTIFSYVPNSSIPAFQGLVDGIKEISLISIQEKVQKGLLQAHELISQVPRTEYLITKNQKVRTFITGDKKRENLLSLQLYEITKGLVTPQDTLVIVDDSIVRGVTIRDALLKKLIQLNPKKIIIVSSAPPVCYPDCYGIDMSQLGRFVAFQAAISLLNDRKETQILEEVKKICLKQKELPASKMINPIRKIYERFNLIELEQKIAEIITPPSTGWKGEVKVIYQTIDGLHQAMPEYTGDWFFSGNYPTPGGFKVLNTSFLKWIESDDSRSY